MIKKADPLTCGIKNCRDSWLFKGCSPLKLSYNLKVKSPANGNISYRQSASCNLIGNC